VKPSPSSVGCSTSSAPASAGVTLGQRISACANATGSISLAGRLAGWLETRCTDKSSPVDRL
jgi:hypothetical protein